MSTSQHTSQRCEVPVTAYQRGHHAQWFLAFLRWHSADVYIGFAAIQRAEVDKQALKKQTYTYLTMATTRFVPGQKAVGSPRPKGRGMCRLHVYMIFLDMDGQRAERYHGDGC